jgi:hypothetical protein
MPALLLSGSLVIGHDVRHLGGRTVGRCGTQGHLCEDDNM